MIQRHLLVVDDELINREIIRECLADTGHGIELVGSAEEAWERLETQARHYDLLILDRMMPGIGGIALLKRMKADRRFRDIPVILQTAATSPEEIREGIEAGAFYYLTKPYDPSMLLAIVRAALADVEEREIATRHAAVHPGGAELIEHASFSFRTIAEIGPLIELLASMCPVPELAAPGLTELLVNAIEHGNLGISYEEKKRLRLDNGWEEEISRRQSLPEYRDRIAHVRVDRYPGRIEFTVTDQGAGFEWQRYLDFDPERAMDPNGRGIALARLTSFASLQYSGSGNMVIATIDTNTSGGAAS